MKLKLATLALGTLVFASCQKHECECTTVFYDSEGFYIGSEDDIKYTVKDESECDSYNYSSTTEVTNCHLDNH